MNAGSRDEEDRSSNEVLRNRWREEEVVLVPLSERSDLPFIGAREGGERLRHSDSVSTTEKRFSFRVTFRIPVVRGKNLDIGLAHSRRGEAGSGGGARVDVPLVLMLIQVGKEPPS